MKKIIGTVILATIVMANTAQAAVQTIKAEVNGMVCAFCAQGIDKKLRELPQIKAVYVNLKHKIVAVELKEDQTLSESTVKDVVKNAGYDVVNIQTVDQTAQQIKESFGKD
ncbi:heavy-metal-associated domain-containing protein [Solimicrobium silvestre]|uniref:Heavy-metal-associated domain n=1 Tax=Solimicrobium silvestre TaxID=2099400 RepID=A0A2S9GSN4_9BURK|nr:heavy metal-associated domain-containing protein [Solimicrobium silvestre]PRC90727.1 Heavy-metal-associated domain [Solimicrobium silvestre]